MQMEAHLEGLLNTSRNSFHLLEKEPVSLLRQSTSWKPFKDHFFKFLSSFFFNYLFRSFPRQMFSLISSDNFSFILNAQQDFIRGKLLL